MDASDHRPFTDEELDLLDDLLAVDDRVFDALVVAARLLRSAGR